MVCGIKTDCSNDDTPGICECSSASGTRSKTGFIIVVSITGIM